MEILEKWLIGWSTSRQLPLPTKFKSGLKVEVGDERQKARYVFPNVNSDFIDLAESITEPWIFLKACAPPDEFSNLLPSRWIIQPQGYMMACFQKMKLRHAPKGRVNKVQVEQIGFTYHAKIISQDGVLAAEGRLIRSDDVAVYDRIFTNVAHRNKGLATQIMGILEEIALTMGLTRNVLVATEMGMPLYTSLGWEVYSLYTSIVIPDS